MSEPVVSAAQHEAPAGAPHPAEAILQVQEGIVIDANPAWIDLFGAGAELLGQPVMDLLDEPSRPALKGALAACLQGRWSGHSLNIGVLRADGTVKGIEVRLALCDSLQHGQPFIQLTMPARPHDERKRSEELEQAVRHDQTTGLLHRRELIEELRGRLGVPIQGGLRCLALVKLDRFAAIERAVGATASEAVLADFARLLREALHPKEIAGRFGGVRFLVLLQRGNERDLQVWARQLVAETARRALNIDGKTLTATCTVGLALVPAGDARLQRPSQRLG